MAIHGKNTYVAIADTQGNLVDVKTYLREASRSRSVDTAESSNFGQNEKTYVVGLNDETMSLSGTFSNEFDLLMESLMDALADGTIDSVEVVYGPGGNTAGATLYTANYIITSYEVSGSTGDVVTASAEFQRTGASVRSLAA